jgi:hypothetical protein
MEQPQSTRKIMPAFTGSYTLDDVQFLLKPMRMDDTPVQIKEQLIQSGKKHYSQLLSHEALPSDDYVALFHEAVALNQQRLAEHLLILAKQIIATRPHGITLVSLARAGTPVGVLLKQVLQRYFQINVTHYSMSILRDVGLDLNALRFILQQHSPESLVFVDGWTGKGVIAQQLATSLAEFERSDGIIIPAELYVLTDLSGSATIAASDEDYLIPSSVLNATVSGLVSRSVYDPDTVALGDFHGCVYYQQFAEHDLSNYFVQVILKSVKYVWQGCDGQLPTPVINREQLQRTSQQLLQRLVEQYTVSHTHYIKPGIGEATRVLLRREARCLLLRDANAKATRHLCWLAEAKSIAITVIPDLPYQAVALIKELSS